LRRHFHVDFYLKCVRFAILAMISMSFFTNASLPPRDANRPEPAVYWRFRSLDDCADTLLQTQSRLGSAAWGKWVEVVSFVIAHPSGPAVKGAFRVEISPNEWNKAPGYVVIVR
jgi:hypothetical protein